MSDEVTVSTRIVRGMVTIGVVSHLKGRRVKANLSPEDAEKLAGRLTQGAVEVRLQDASSGERQ